MIKEEMKHIPEQIVDLLIIKPEELSAEEKSRILEHIEKCKLCDELYKKLLLLNKEIEDSVSSNPTSEDLLVSEKILFQNNILVEKKLLNEHSYGVKIYDGHTEIIEPGKKKLIHILMDFAKDNSLKISGSLALTGLIVAILFFYKKPEIKYINPTLAIIKNNVLKVYNEMGDLLWKKGVPGMEDYRTDISFDNQKAVSGTREMLLDDFDGDGKNELLMTGNYSRQGILAKDTLYCYNGEGKLNWKYGCGLIAKFNTPRWKFGDLFIANYFTLVEKYKKGKRLFVIAGSTYAPTKLFELDIKSGKAIQEFYNAGGITAATVFDLNGDGKDEIFIGGINNAFSAAFIAMFEPDSVKGFSPATELYIPAVAQKNSSSHYIIIPQTKYGRMVSLSDYNTVEKFLISKEEKAITAYVQEVPAPGHQKNVQGVILYNFGKEMKLNSVVLGDNFTSNYTRRFKTGKIKEPLDTGYTNRLVRGVKQLK